MTRVHRTFLILSLVSVVALPALANDVECGPAGANCGPGLGGTVFSLVVTPDNASDKAYVQSSEPNGETSFNFDFRIDPQTVTLDNNKLMRTHLAFGAQHHILLQLQWKSTPANYKIWMWARQDLAANGAKYSFVGKATILPNTDNPMRVEWIQSTSAGAGNGEARLLKNLSIKGQRLDLDTFDHVVDFFRAGLPSGSAGSGAPGTDDFLLDEYVLTR